MIQFEQQFQKNIVSMDYEKYNIQQIVNFKDIPVDFNNQDLIKNAYWFPNLHIVNALVNYCKFYKKTGFWRLDQVIFLFHFQILLLV